MKISMRHLTHASRQVATKSAMNPILWLSAIVSPAALTLSYLSESPISYLLMLIAVVPIFIACAIFSFFALRDPDRLQSETHLERMEVLARFQNPETGSVVMIDSEPSTSNAPKLEARQ